MATRYIIGLICFGLLFSCKDKKTNDALTQSTSHKADSIQILKNRIDTLSKQIFELKEDLKYWFSDIELDKLKEKGITDPIRYLQDDLYKHPQLIPYSATLGGTMRFWKMTLLGDRWAIAYFEDGHNGGRILLEYAIMKDNSIKWTPIRHYIE